MSESTEDCDLTLQIVTWDQYFNGIIRERVFNTVEEYTVQGSYFDENAGKDLPEQPSTIDSTYHREIVLIEDLEEPSAKVREQFFDQLKKNEVEIHQFSNDFQESVNEACLHAMDNFVELEKCVLIKLTETEYMLAPTTRDDLVLKLLSFTKGAIVIYKPKMFTRFKVV